ncbi:TetR/AcrR family transcriptional regulator [Sphingosinicella soli]|uniref:AcrR family transcriptional regulator n=1 Tax=Sphingosinicella soli TaxID=333708 RepID=A0A7W7FAN7_9SPHN|nr:TetR/AcrR family transcriptional regulator [Sphingosinicella soli]MBB4633863.1 AcrR family transcriptional regulator [Sphingosinicella soli]
MTAQAQKIRQVRSERTRKRLIDATISSLVKYGYSRTNPLRVAAEAGVTRGAVLHHFKDGADLIHATIIELQEKRLRALGRVTDIEFHEVGKIMRTYWEQLSSPTAIAFEEIRNAARTDGKLAEILRPVEREYQERWDLRAVDIFADWQSDPKNFEIAITLAQTVLEGLAVRNQWGLASERTIELMLEQLEQQIISLHPRLRKDR